MNVMTKRGSLDNVVTYEHFCDEKKDLVNIPQDQINLGSVAIILKDENDALGIYIANSKKEWIEVSTSTDEGSAVDVDLIHICSNEDYDSVTGIPTIQEPEENKIYFVPNNGDNNNLFEEWIYVNGEWEKFGSAGSVIPSANINADWFQNDNTTEDYIKNRIGGYYKYNNLTPVYTGTLNYGMLQNNNNQNQFSILYTFEFIPINNLSSVTNFFDWINGQCLIVDINGERHYLDYIEFNPGNTSGICMERFPVNNSILTVTYDISNNSQYLEMQLSTNSELFTENPEIKIYRDSNAIIKIPYVFLELPEIKGENEGCISLNLKNNNTRRYNNSSNQYALAANYQTSATNKWASAFGYQTTASGEGSFATGNNCTTSGDYSHVEGNYNYIDGNGDYAHAEGSNTQAIAEAAHAEGIYTVASGQGAHAEGDHTQSSGNGAHAEGIYTIATSNAQHVFGAYNIADITNIEIVGNGEIEELRSNARTLDWSGNEWLAGSLTLNQTTLTENNLIELLNLRTTEVNIPGTDAIIAANSNTRYICGEVSTLDFTPSSTGICNIRFISGSSKTILTLPSTVKMPEWFEVEANMVYEISIADGIYGVVTSWAV